MGFVDDNDDDVPYDGFRRWRNTTTTIRKDNIMTTDAVKLSELTTTATITIHQQQQQAQAQGQTQGQRQRLSLSTLPMEIQLMILSQADLHSLVSLRGTCRLYRNVVITPVFVARQGFKVAGGYDPRRRRGGGMGLVDCCAECLCLPGSPQKLVLVRNTMDGIGIGIGSGFGSDAVGSGGGGRGDDGGDDDDIESGGGTTGGDEDRDRGTDGGNNNNLNTNDNNNINNNQKEEQQMMTPRELMIRARQLASPNWRSVCLRCYRTHHTSVSAERARRARHQAVRFLTLADGLGAYVCGYCGWVVTRRDAARRGPHTINGDPEGDDGGGHFELGGEKPHFHRGSCRRKKIAVTSFWFVVGFVQFCLGLIGIAAAWGVYAEILAVVVPVTAAYLLSWFSLLVTLGIMVGKSASQNPRNWLWLLVPEVAMAVLWVPPVVAAAKGMYPEELARDSFPIFALSMFGANLLFRLINCVGFTLLHFDYDPRSAQLPKGVISPGERTGRFFLNVITWWAFPRW